MDPTLAVMLTSPHEIASCAEGNSRGETCTESKDNTRPARQSPQAKAWEGAKRSSAQLASDGRHARCSHLHPRRCSNCAGSDHAGAVGREAKWSMEVPYRGRCNMGRSQLRRFNMGVVRFDAAPRRA